MNETPPLTGERTTPGVPEENYWFRRHVAAYRFARRYARGRVLDAGAGEGYGAAMLARRARVTGIELDVETVAEAARRYPAVRFLRADLCCPPVAGASVDAVIALQVLEHLPCADRFLAQCRSALCSGGRMVLSTPNRANFPAGLNPFHVHEYGADDLRAVLTKHFGSVTLLGIVHRSPLARLDRFLGEGVQHRLVRTPYREQPLWLRAVLRTVTSRDFRVTREVESSLDLLAVCRA